MNEKNQTKWIWKYRGLESPTCRWVCVPGAGQGASFFNQWIKAVPNWVEFCAIQLPGRENRIKEPLEEDFSRLLDQLASACTELFDRPVLLFGYSMGALLAYELAGFIEESGNPWLKHFVAAGCVAPRLATDLNRAEVNPSNFSDEMLLEYLENSNGMSILNRNCPELVDLVLPILRADYRSYFSYEWKPGNALRVPITAIGGVDDEITIEQLEAWRYNTTGKFRTIRYPGNHSFVKSAFRAVIRDMAAIAEPIRFERWQLGRW